jgi:hypothetical protein
MDVLLALDIGGTKVAAGLVTREGMVIDRGRIAVRSNQSDENLFNDVAQLVDAMLTKARGQHGAQPVALGVGCAGPMAENAELVSPLNIPCWRNFPLVPRLRTLTGLPVFADGDAKALALGEGWKGAAKGHDNFLAMVVSTVQRETPAILGMSLWSQAAAAAYVAPVAAWKQKLLAQPLRPSLAGLLRNRPMKLFSALAASWAAASLRCVTCSTFHLLWLVEVWRWVSGHRFSKQHKTVLMNCADSNFLQEHVLFRRV